MTAYSVSLEWNPSTDNSGSVTYTICCANTSSETFPGPASTYVYRAGLEAGRSFTLFIIAKDVAGNYSKQSNTVTFTLPRDTTPPTKPTATVTDVRPAHVSLSWSSVEDGPNVWFTVFMNGNAVWQGFEVLTTLPEQEPFDFAIVKRDGVELMFQSRVSLSENVPALTGVPISASQTLYIEVTGVRDLNGYILSFSEAAPQ